MIKVFLESQDNIYPIYYNILREGNCSSISFYIISLFIDVRYVEGHLESTDYLIIIKQFPCLFNHWRTAVTVQRTLAQMSNLMEIDQSDIRYILANYVSVLGASDDY